MVALVIAIVAAIALLVIGIKHLWDTNEGFRTAVTNIWNGIKTTIGGVVNAIVGFFKAAKVKLWQIAEQYGLNDGDFSRKLRHELSQEEKQKIRLIIVELK